MASGRELFFVLALAAAHFLAEEGLNSIARMRVAPKEPNKSTV